jgi:3'-phosphoadenosine 5'-phosphosulfate sulfotransferase (PAPS reductase)/FAD synthetase
MEPATSCSGVALYANCTARTPHRAAKKEKKMIVSWFSAGVSSAVATKISLSKYPALKIIYTHINDQHPDTLRFIHDCEEWFDRPVEILQGKYKTVEQACLAFGKGYLVGPAGANCTRLLKRRVRHDWEMVNPGRHTYVWGMDFEEKKRMDGPHGIIASNPDQDHVVPLIENGLTKKEVHGMIREAGIQRPAMYDLGYPNNNCIGCIKGGMGYWNKIRQDFPDVFESRAKLERKIGAYILHDNSGPVWLDELAPERGRGLEIIVPDCGLFCEIPKSAIHGAERCNQHITSARAKCTEELIMEPCPSPAPASNTQDNG